MAFLNDFTNVISPGRNELVFEGKNKEYGAYVIRRDYARTVIWVTLFTCVLFILVASLPKIIELIKGAQTEEMVVAVDLTPTDLEPPPMDEKEPPPPPPPPPPPVMETIKFTPPVVVDEVIEDKEPPPPQEVETQVSTVTQEGAGDDVIVVDEGNGVVEAVEEVFTIVEAMPEFEGGMPQMYAFLKKNLQYPAMEKDAQIEGTVYLTFVVEKDGKITDVKTLRGVKGGPGLEKEAVRVVNMMPPWKAGKQNGRAVRVQFNLPIKFSLGK